MLHSGKSLFIEKPPCQTLEELDTLIALQQQYGIPIAMVGMQKRYAPAIQLLKKRLNKERLINYDLHYLTGAYPEGDALLDLYIHPLDLVCFLFGKPEILAYHQIAKDSYILMLRHPHIVGTLELSTAYSWTDAEESLKVCTCSGSYRLSQMEELSFTPSSRTVSGIPMEKLRPHKRTIEYLYQNNSFSPILSANQVYSQGYFNELATFVEAVEHHDSHIISTLETIRDTYRLMDNLKRT